MSFSTLNFSNASYAISMVSDCMSSDMSTFLMTGLRLRTLLLDSEESPEVAGGELSASDDIVAGLKTRVI